VVRRHPSILAAALAVTIALAVAGIAGVLVASASEERHRRDTAQGFADTAAVGFGIQLQQMLAPLLALATFIHDQPNYPTLARRFEPIAKELLAAVRRARGAGAARKGAGPGARGPPPPPRSLGPSHVPALGPGQPASGAAAPHSPAPGH
jgi:hypothetical protein